MFGNHFQHYLSYGATDQHSIRELAGKIDGLIVPGTVAAFQREGTGGFVLSLSAAIHIPYAIDPRFPLFQQALVGAKKSHMALADLLGAPKLASSVQPSPESFTADLIETVSAKWAAFNENYHEAVAKKFEKYAKRLKEEVVPGNARGPSFVLPPYLSCGGVADPYWAISGQLFSRTAANLKDPGKAVRVVAAKEVGALGELLADVDGRRVVVWVSGLDELTATADSLAIYGRAFSGPVKSTFALYGGFFSVLLSCVGLGGASHGIGFGEYRAYLELPQSGPPPARYYLPTVHRYVSQEHAFLLWKANPALGECGCDVCDGRPPIALDYHSLMMHSVLCRAAEVETWGPLDLSATLSRLTGERQEFLSRLNGSDLADIIKAEGLRNAAHLEVWIRALQTLQNEGIG